MKKIALISIACSFLLAGCWDERLYKELTIVPLHWCRGGTRKMDWILHIHRSNRMVPSVIRLLKEVVYP